MDYVEWCELVLRTMGIAGDESALIRNNGIDEDSLARRVWGESHPEVTEQLKTEEGADVIYTAVFDLHKTRLVDDANATFIKLTRDGRGAAKEIFPVWENACLIRLDPLLQSTLKIINKHSQLSNKYFALVRFVPMNTVHCELDDDQMTQEDIWEVLRELEGLGLIWWDGGTDPDEIRATYRGLVWETRRDQVIGSRFIDGLVAEWETTSVEFKRELRLDTADQKAEFVKDVIGLANTQASGRRWLIVGFDDRTRAYHTSPDLTVTQDRIENILARYTAPHLDVRYETIIYKGGLVGRLEVLRDPRKLPYKVAKSLGGENRRISQGQIFVRHGSQTEVATEAELQEIQAEAARARRNQI